MDEQIASLENYMEASASLLRETAPKVVDMSARFNALRCLLDGNKARTEELNIILQTAFKTEQSTETQPRFTRQTMTAKEACNLPLVAGKPRATPYMIDCLGLDSCGGVKID